MNDLKKSWKTIATTLETGIQFAFSLRQREKGKAMSQAAYQINEYSFPSSVMPLQEAVTEALGLSRILVVDDDAVPRELISSCLVSQEFQTLTAVSGEDAIAQLKDNHFDLVLTDMSMPGMSGMEVLKWVRKHQPTVPVVLITGKCELKTAVESMRLGAFDYVTKPFQLETVLDRVDKALEERSQTLKQEQEQHKLNACLDDRSEALNLTLTNLAVEHDATLEALIRALDARAHETDTHSARVREYALCLAARLELTDPQIDDLSQGALLHDVGMIGVSDTILLKNGKLTATEWRDVRKHPLIGPRIVGNIHSVSEGVVDVITSHHERFDGTGYPDGLRDKEIPFLARIFSVVDTYDAITSDRPYRKARSSTIARREIAGCAGHQLDPSIVEVFLRIPQSELDEAAQAALLEGSYEDSHDSFGTGLESVTT